HVLDRGPQGPRSSFRPIRAIGLTLVWEGSRLRALLVALVAVKVVGLIVLFDWSQRAIDVFDLPKSLFSRAVEWFILGVLVVALLRWGTSIVPRSRVHVLMGAVALAYLLASVTAEDRHVSLFGARG